MKKTKKITVAIEDLGRVCHVCGKVDDSVRRRSYRGTDYKGGCGDSFCWASCEETSCRGVEAQACETCEKNRRVPS